MQPTEFEFTLPRGFLDAAGTIHREGRMRLATALDEIEPLHDPRVRANPGYLTVLLLSRVVTRLGTLPAVTAAVVEGLYVADLAYLQALYRQVNEQGVSVFSVTCPHCQTAHEVDLVELGGA